MASLILAGLSTPLVLSVHSVVSFDFAVSVLPGWHATIFPPYFVAGAIYSGFGMVLTLAIPIRSAYRLEHLITMKHIDNMAKVMLATGLIVAYGYAMEAFFGWYSANQYERFMLWNRMTGPYAWSYWLLIFINAVLIHVLWFKSVRHNLKVMFVLSLIVNLAMWLERFVIIVTSLHRDFVPSSWDMYYPTRWDFMTYFGTFGLFLTLVLPVHALRADDLDLRSAHAAARSQGARAARSRRPRRRTPGLSHAGEHGENRPLRADGRVRLGPGASSTPRPGRLARATPGSRPTRRSRSKS